MNETLHNSNETLYNPFLEDSKEVPREEVIAAAKELAKEAATARSRTSEIKEKAYQARSEKEAALKAKADQLAAEVEKARAHLVKTVAGIPKPSDTSYVRPEAPKIEDLDPDLAEVFGSVKASPTMATSSTPSLACMHLRERLK